MQELGAAERPYPMLKRGLQSIIAETGIIVVSGSEVETANYSENQVY